MVCLVFLVLLLVPSLWVEGRTGDEGRGDLVALSRTALLTLPSALQSVAAFRGHPRQQTYLLMVMDRLPYFLDRFLDRACCLFSWLPCYFATCILVPAWWRAVVFSCTSVVVCFAAIYSVLTHTLLASKTNAMNEQPMYVVVDLSAAAEAAGEPIRPGDVIKLTNAGTATPCIVLASGKRIQGEYKESVGTHMAYKEHLQGGQGDQPPRVELCSHSTQLLTFPKPPRRGGQ